MSDEKNDNSKIERAKAHLLPNIDLSNQNGYKIYSVKTIYFPKLNRVKKEGKAVCSRLEQ